MRMNDLDNHIMGVNQTYRDDGVLHRCPKCGAERRLPMVYDMGGWFYPNAEIEDKAFCDCCQIELEIVAEIKK